MSHSLGQKFGRNLHDCMGFGIGFGIGLVLFEQFVIFDYLKILIGT